MEQRKTVLKKIITIYAVFSILVTTFLGIALLTNLNNISQVIKVVTLIKTKALQPLNDEKLATGAAVGMVEALKDPYSTYLDPELFKSLTEHITGSYGGVGLLVTMEQENRLVVVSPFKGTPAHQAGIMSGDWIVKIDDQDTTQMPLDKAASLMQGKPDTKVKLSVQREGQEGVKDYELTRKIIQIPSVEGQMLKENSDIAYVSITQFSERTGQELTNVLNDLGKNRYKGIILDLRNNPGGLLPAALEVASIFVPKGPIVHIVGKNDSETYKAPGGYLQVPLAVLVNKGSASASEIVSGAIKDTKSGILVGERTFGKGLVQTVFELGGGAAVKLTTAKYLTPNKIDINKKGIEPNIKVALPQSLEREALLNAPNEDKDPQLKKAIEALHAQLQ
ncbi:S41 family peptidase [Bacillota bacterium LX-D]|nr:S41 family peptidase [Bacillota bacterium LX-D]